MQYNPQEHSGTLQQSTHWLLLDFCETRQLSAVEVNYWDRLLTNWRITVVACLDDKTHQFFYIYEGCLLYFGIREQKQILIIKYRFILH